MRSSCTAFAGSSSSARTPQPLICVKQRSKEPTLLAKVAFARSAGRCVTLRSLRPQLSQVQAFLLFGPLSQTTWPKKLAESRSAYTSLREHFLRYINNPDDLQSNVDPLSDDTSVGETSGTDPAVSTANG